MSQLALDVWATSRTRPGTRPPEDHQWGWITLPRGIAAHPMPGHPRPAIGDVLPAWVCCRCGGVELSWRHVNRSHACCDPNTVRHQCDRRDTWPGWSRDFDPAWTPHRPA